MPESVTCPTRVVELEARALKEDAFDELVRELESDVEGGEHLREGRRWVAQTFYAAEDTLTSLRLKAGLSQEQLAEAVGMKQPNISNIEAGKHDVKFSTLSKLAAALGVDFNTLSQALARTMSASVTSEA